VGESNTLNLAFVKEKGFHRASTVCPPLAPASSSGPSHAAWYSLVPYGAFSKECIAIALDAQPIQPALCDYAAPRHVG